MPMSSGARDAKKPRHAKHVACSPRRDIVVGAENPRTGKTIAEKAQPVSTASVRICWDEQVLKYMEDKLTQKDIALHV